VHAQVTVNIGTPPMWGPVGYSNVQYYYLPDVEAYYDVPSAQFIYLNDGAWIRRSYLPVRYRNYNLYSGYKVVMTGYHGNKPYYKHAYYKHNYAKGYRGPVQKNIGTKPSKSNIKTKIHSDSHVNKYTHPGNSKNNGNGDAGNSNHGNQHGGGNGKNK
jgi:hypothetical protein